MSQQQKTFRPLLGLVAALGLSGVCSGPVLAGVTLTMPGQPKTEVLDLKPGERPQPKSLEEHIWAEADDKERIERSLGDQNTDPHLTLMVQGVLQKLAPNYQKDLRVLVVDRPYSAAIMAPNGFLVVPSGLLLWAQTEDQLAFLMGREFIHYKRRHGLQAVENQKTVGGGLAMASVVPGVGSAVKVVGMAGGVSQLSRYVTDADHALLAQRRYAYTTEQEQEADLLAFKLLPAAGYSVETALRLWDEILRDKAEKAKAQQGVKVPGLPGYKIDEAYVAKVRQDLGVLPIELAYESKRKAYRAKIRPHMAAWFEMELKRKGFGRVITLATGMRDAGEDLGFLTFIEAEAYRLRGRDAQNLDDLSKAEGLYRAALKYKDCPARAHVGLGTVEALRGHSAEAILAFKAYLAAEPKAKDAWIIQDQIAALSEKAS